MSGDDRPLDAFEKEALAELTDNPARVYYRLEPYEGRPALRYVVSQLADESCVRCHNAASLFQIPVWDVGDFLGAIEVIRPLDAVHALARRRLVSTAVLLFVVGLAALAGIALVGGRLKRETEMSQQLNRRMYITNEELTMQATELLQPDAEGKEFGMAR